MAVTENPDNPVLVPHPLATAHVIAQAHGVLRAAASDVLAAYQRYLDTDDLDALRDSLTVLTEALAFTVPTLPERGYTLAPADDPAYALVVVDGRVVARVPRESLDFPAYKATP